MFSKQTALVVATDQIVIRAVSNHEGL